MTVMGPDVEQEARKLAGVEGLIDDRNKGVQLRQATISSYDAGTKLATITLGGDTTPIVGVASLASYTPNASDTGVWVAMIGTTPLLVGAVSSAGAKAIRFGTFDAQINNGDTQSNTSVSFGYTFPSTPEVVCQITVSPSNPVFWEVTSRSTTGFAVDVGKVSLTAFGAGASYRFSYVASVAS